MKRLAIIGLIFFAPITAYASTCGYESMSGTEYKIKETYKKYVFNDFVVNPNKDKFGSGQRSDRNYKSLRENTFKVMSTDYVTVDSKVYEKKPASNRFRELVIDDKAYTLDRYFNIELLTSDCVKYYYAPNGTKESFDYAIQKTDGTANTVQDLVAFLGKSLKPAKVTATSEYDEFDKQYQVKTDFFKDQMIRGYLDSKKENPTSIQVYMTLAFLDKWGFVDTAKDKNGATHEVATIDKEADCAGKSLGLGCILKETVGVSVDEDFLRKNTEGFELKLSGKQSKVVFVSGELVTAFLSELDRLKN